MTHKEDIEALDWHIREHTRIADANQDMGEHFLEKAADHRAQAEEYRIERDRLLGTLATENIIPFPHDGGFGDAIA